MLHVEHLCKSFGGTVALDDVGIVVGPGESVGLVGPNGAGKTTLFECVAGTVRPDAGTVRFAGRDLGTMAPWRRARLGMSRTYQRVEVFPELTVRDHLLVADRACHRQPRLWRDLLGLAAPRPAEVARVDAVLELVGLGTVADIPVAALGLGTCRLVELARAIMCEPRLLLADEPSSGLDEHETAELAQVLRALQRERSLALVVVEHDLAMVEAVVDRVVVMDLGKVIATGTFPTVMAATQVRRAYLGAS